MNVEKTEEAETEEHSNLKQSDRICDEWCEKYQKSQQRKWTLFDVWDEVCTVFSILLKRKFNAFFLFW
jgi:hypothetical protein